MSLFQLSALRDKVSPRSYDIIVYSAFDQERFWFSREKWLLQKIQLLR
jgi:hypothetical protein